MDDDDGGKESEGDLIEGSNDRTRNAGSKTSTVMMQGDKELERRKSLLRLLMQH